MISDKISASENLKGKTPYKNLMEFLDKEFGEDKIYDVFNAFKEFENVREKTKKNIAALYI